MSIYDSRHERLRDHTRRGTEKRKKVHVWIERVNSRHGAYEAGMMGYGFIGYGASPAATVKALMKDARKNRGKDAREF